MKTKRVFSLLLCAALVFALLPTAALAAGTGSFVVTGDTSGYSYADHTLTFNADAAGKTYTVSMASGVGTLTADKIVVNGGTPDQPVGIILDNIHIYQAYVDCCAFELENSSVVNLTLRGDNVLTSGKYCAGLLVPEGATINIFDDSTTPAADSLTANGGDYAPGIGGGDGADNTFHLPGTVVINGGTVSANGGSRGAGIGGLGGNADCTVAINGGTVTASGRDAGAGIGGDPVTISGSIVTANGGYNGAGICGGTVTITGGTVAASGGGDGGAGIGGGSGKNGGAVYISGGSVHAKGGDNAEAIGKGNGGASSGTLQNNVKDQEDVYLATVTLNGVSGKTPVSPVNFSAGGKDYDYGAEDMQTDAQGALYLYLPIWDCNLQMKADAYSYAAALTVASTGGTEIMANDLSSTNIVINTPGTYVLTGSSVSNKITVSGGTETNPVNITLDGVSVYQYPTESKPQVASPFDLKSGSFVNLTLSGRNRLYGYYTALNVPDGAALTIEGGGSLEAVTEGARYAGIGGSIKENCGSVTINDGTVTATGGTLAAGIGGGCKGDDGTGGDGGTVTINGGTVFASSALSGFNNDTSYGAGIGGGAGGSGGTITINGGTVIANHYDNSYGDGACIGGGNSGNGGTVTITGGTVIANSGGIGAGIGGGANGSGGTVYISGGSVYAFSIWGKAIGAGSAGSGDGTLQNNSNDHKDVYLTTVTLRDTTGAAFGDRLVSSLTISLNGSVCAYGAKDMQTDADGKLYLYLTEDAAVTAAQSAGQHYLGSVAAKSQGALALSSVTPDETGTYTIVSAAGMGGSISPSGSVTVADGEDKTFTISANDGYEIKDVMVDGVSVGTVSSFTFENMKKAHTITAVFTGKKTVNPFADVKDGDWFYDSVMYVYENSLMNGTGSGSFNPNGGMTRGMFVTVLYRLSGDTGSYSCGFTDVPSGAWYENTVAWAVQNGLAGGVGGNRFAPDTDITREQIAVMLYNYEKYKGCDISVGEDTNILSYQDALNISDYAYPALQWACGSGIINGDNNGYLNPQSTATRAEVAAMLKRL